MTFASGDVQKNHMSEPFEHSKIKKVLWNIVDIASYQRNYDLHRDLGIFMVEEDIQKMAGRHETRLQHHVNVELHQLPGN